MIKSVLLIWFVLTLTNVYGQSDSSEENRYPDSIFFPAYNNNRYPDSILFPVYINTDSISHLKHHHPFPLKCAKISIVRSDDDYVKKLYGDGLFTDEGGHGGTRFFVDPHKRVILKSVIGVDNRIEEVGFCSYSFQFDFLKDTIPGLFVSKNLKTDPLMIGKIQLGDASEKIIQLFGLPNYDKMEDGIRDITYEDSYQEWDAVLFYSITYEFLKNRLVNVIMYNGE